MGFCSNLMIKSQPARYCYSTKKYNDYIKILERKLISEWFSWTYCVDCIDYIELTENVVHINPHKKSHYHAPIVKNYFLVTVINIVLTLHARMSVM